MVVVFPCCRLMMLSQILASRGACKVHLSYWGNQQWQRLRRLEDFEDSQARTHWNGKHGHGSELVGSER